MRLISIFIIYLFLTNNELNAQMNQFRKEKNDTTVFLWGGLKILVLNNPGYKSTFDLSNPVRKNSSPHFYTGIDIGLNGFLNNQGNVNLSGEMANLNLNYSRSWHININLMENFISIVKKRVGLVTGFGIGFNGYQFSSSNVTITNNKNAAHIGFDTSLTKDFTKNKLRISSLEVPLLIGITSKQKISKYKLRVSAGIIGAWNFSIRYKLKYKEGSIKNELIVKDDFRINPFKVKLTIRTTYMGLKLYANYSLTPLIRRNQGPEIYPFEAGITF